jgi:hypothetical protein
VSHCFVPAALPTVKPLSFYLIYVRGAADLVMPYDSWLEEHADGSSLVKACFSREYFKSAAQLVGEFPRDERVTGR